MKRALTELAWFCVFFGIAIGTISFWFSLPFAWAFQPMVFVTTLLVVFGLVDRALLAAAVFGMLFDLFSALPFGIGLLSFMVSVLVVFFSQHTFFKEQAIHTIVIHTCFAVASFHVVFYVCTLIAQKTGFSGSDAIYPIGTAASIAGMQIILCVVSIVLVYLSTMVFRRRFIHTESL